MHSAFAATLLAPNPVWRSYLGGSVLRRFRCLAGAEDNHFPEDWLASTVRARNGEHASSPHEGLSSIAVNGTVELVPDLIRKDPAGWFGCNGARPRCGHGLGVLWKLLDSSVRLQFQAHPSAEFARAHLNSNAGKTECWYILSTRGDGHVFLGFQHPPSRKKWAGIIREQDVEGMMRCFERVPVRAGDCYVVPAGTPHAIGPGIFMVELMEPTDWVVRCETENAGLKLPPDACFMGLTLDACLDVFDYGAHSIEQVRKTLQQHARVLAGDGSFSHEEIIGPAWHQFFRLERLRGSGNADWAGGELMLLIVIQGSGEIAPDANSSCCTAGQTWLLPGCIEHWDWHCTTQWELLLLKLPC